MSAVDLNLLRIFQALAEERSVTRAAGRVGLSQPAFSHALARLRRMLGDPLFVRVPRGMAPTARALELEVEVRELLARAEQITRPAAFDPAACERTFRLATTDYFEHIALPEVAVELARAAPRATVAARPTTSRLPTRELERGTLDLAVAGFYGEPPASFYRQTLFDESFVCIVRKAHPVVRDRLTLAQYTRLSHLLISPGADLHGVVDQVLAARGKRRHVAIGTSSFLSAGRIVARSDLVLTAPRRIGLIYQESAPVRLVPPPIELPGIQVAQIWHARQHRDPAHVWLRRLIASACSAV